MKLIAFDSGIERTGYAVFDLQERKYELGDYGCITTSSKHKLQDRISELYDQVENLTITHKAELFVFERLFFNINKKTAIMVAQAQGAVMALAGKHNIKTTFITPGEIKLALTGYGNADKKSVQKMVKILLELSEVPKPDDTADAIACGLTYCTTPILNSKQSILY